MFDIYYVTYKQGTILKKLESHPWRNCVMQGIGSRFKMAQNMKHIFSSLWFSFFLFFCLLCGSPSVWGGCNVLTALKTEPVQEKCGWVNDRLDMT